MKSKIRILFFLLLLSGSLIAQAPNWLWADKAGGLNSENVFSLTLDAAGNCYATGSFGSASITFGTTTLTNAGDENMFLVKFDPSGNVIWAKQAGGPDHDFGYGVKIDAAGNCYVTGGYGSDTVVFDSTHILTNANTGYYNIFVAKYDANGNLLWTKSAGGVSYDWGESISTDTLGNCYITGSFLSPSITFDTITITNSGSYDFFVAKYDPAGNLVWVNQIGSNGNDRGISIKADSSGNCYIAGTFGSSSLQVGTTTLNGNGSGDVFLIKLDNAGNAIWAKSAGGISDDGASCVTLDPFGNCYLSGYYKSGSVTFGSSTITNSVSSYNLFIGKYDTSGNVLWAKGVGGANDDFANSIAADSAGNSYVTGWFKSASLTFGSYTITNAGTDNNIFLAKYDSAGTVLWAKKAGGQKDDRGYSVAVSHDDNCFLGGSFTSTSLTLDTITLTNMSTTNYWDLFVAKLDLDPDGIEDHASSSDHYLIYPNPATNEIKITLPAGEISIMNAAGQIIYSQEINSQSELNIDTHLMPEGIYFLRFISNGISFTEKLMIAR